MRAPTRTVASNAFPRLDRTLDETIGPRSTLGSANTSPDEIGARHLDPSHGRVRRDHFLHCADRQQRRDGGIRDHRVRGVADVDLFAVRQSRSWPMITTDQMNDVAERILRCKAELVRVEQMISRDMIELVNLDATWLLEKLTYSTAFIEEIYAHLNEREELLQMFVLFRAK